jgi:small subunit ribosomal protein S18
MNEQENPTPEQEESLPEAIQPAESPAIETQTTEPQTVETQPAAAQPTEVQAAEVQTAEVQAAATPAPAAQSAEPIRPTARREFLDAAPIAEDEGDDFEDESDEEGDESEDDEVYVSGPAEYVQRERSGRGRRIGGDVRPEDVDYKNIPVLSRFLDRRGRILSRRKTRVSAKVQRRIVQAIKRARHLALLPYTAEQTRIVRKRR